MNWFDELPTAAEVQYIDTVRELEQISAQEI
jgi:hypothetical protein